MSDFNLSNQPGAAFRSELNDILAELQANSYGPTAPTTTTPGQIWADNSGASPALKMRNAADSGWISIPFLTANTFTEAQTVQTSSGDQVSLWKNTDTGDADIVHRFDVGDTGEARWEIFRDGVDTGFLIEAFITGNQWNINAPSGATVDFQFGGAGPSVQISEAGVVANNAPVAHGFVTNNGTATLVNDFGISSVSRSGVGVVNVIFDNAQAGSNYTVLVTTHSSLLTFSVATINSSASFSLKTYDSAGALSDEDFSFVVYPDL